MKMQYRVTEEVSIGVYKGIIQGAEEGINIETGGINGDEGKGINENTMKCQS